jgi:folylpolyglutamate synthase/dihydrofolate synthase
MNKFNKYEDVLNWLYRLKRFGMTKGVDNLKILAEEFKNIHDELKVILVTGSGGKGSTVAILSKILEKSNYKVGTFTKPHLHRYTERISINSQEISREDLIEIANRIYNKIEEIRTRREYYPTFFEVTSMISILYFYERNVDLCIYEVGIGGRYDATNILNPLISCITRVYLEHTNILGNTVEDIAWNKVGIARENRFLITGESDNRALRIIKDECSKIDCEVLTVGKEKNKDIIYETVISNLNENKFNYFGLLNEYNNLELNLKGDHQQLNCSIAIACCEILKILGYNINEGAIREALKDVKWAGRMEIFNYGNTSIILDAAKDPYAMNTLVNFLIRNGLKDVIVVISISSDKDYKNMLSELLRLSNTFILSKHKVMERAILPEKLKEALLAMKNDTKIYVINDIKEAVKKALEISNKEKPILVTGSVFTVAEAREFLKNEESDSINLADPHTLIDSSP